MRSRRTGRLAVEVVLLGSFLLCFAPLIHAMCAPVYTQVVNHDMHHVAAAPDAPADPITPATPVLAAAPAGDSTNPGSPAVPLDAGAALTLLVGLGIVALVVALRPSLSLATVHSRSAEVRLGGIPPPRTRPPLLPPIALGVLRT